MGMKKIILFALIGVILAGGVIAGVLYFTVFRSTADKPIKTYEHNLGDFTANLSSTKNFFRSTIVVETTNDDMIVEMKKKNAVIRDQIIKIMLGKKTDDLLSPEGLSKIQEEIKSNLSSILDTDSITNVFFIDYIIQ
ncbi:flagellar basal body-associated FliL family protein [Alkaliphilus serpentinus]|uniref:Flagellar protein FliL n=1 Tax=Alkaliphilus serpentinus TaxID=1482731 RepID=A0A833HPY5_9FIRM|nr:flagellar basal body-associated FliL family protein [Alkaliphilus serpentinus]KAB3531376.1 flagellar basal body-associated FliL family protein [Alkaliphilus serpentinus]